MSASFNPIFSYGSELMTESCNPIRILTVDEHPVLRERISELIADEPDMTLVAAANGREAIQQFRSQRPDITIMDLLMPEMCGLEAMASIRGECPEARIIVLATYGADVQALRALKAGAHAYVLKTALQKDLLNTIRTVHTGKKTSPEVSFQPGERAAEAALSPAEIRVLHLIANGNSDKVIAAKLAVTEEKVKGQVGSVLCKLSAHDRTHAAMIGVKRGIIEL